MIKRSQATLAVAAGLATSLCFLAPQAFADGVLTTAPAPITETSSDAAAG